MTTIAITDPTGVGAAADAIITGAIDLIASPDNWLDNTNGPHYNAPVAVDAAGADCEPESANAVRWTINGALMRAAGPVIAAGFCPGRPRYEPLHQARAQVNGACNRYRFQAAGKIWMDDWQRYETHAAVLALLDRARGGPSLPTGTAYISNGGRLPERSRISPPGMSLRGRRR